MLSVVSYGAQSDGPWTGLGAADGAAAQVAATQSEVFQSARHILERAGAQVSATQGFGDPAHEILNEASDWGADLILVGHHNGLARWFLGSVTESVVKRSSIPLLVVPKLPFSGSRARDPKRASAEANQRVRFAGRGSAHDLARRGPIRLASRPPPAQIAPSPRGCGHSPWPYKAPDRPRR
jgi:hypothetical protein